MMKNFQLGAAEARRVVRLLGEYQGLLESDIAGNLLEDGSTMPNDPAAARHVAKCRRNWRAAEGLVKRLSAIGRKP